jgi:hypothetical protein
VYEEAVNPESAKDSGRYPEIYFAVIPNRCNRKQPFNFNSRFYKLVGSINELFSACRRFADIGC